jgi:hypothetical protein
MAFKLNNKLLPTDVAFTSNGIKYPANWLRLSSLSEKNAIGITEVADEAAYDQRFYWSAGRAKDLAELKTRYITEQKGTTNSLLRKYDWYVTRKAEKGTAIPSTIVTYRNGVRTTCITRENEINACSDVAALKTLIDSTLTSWPKDPNE